MRIPCLLTATLALAPVGCSSSSTTTTTGSDGGSKHDAAASHDSATAHPDASGPTEKLTTTCSPAVDVSKATNLMPMITTVAAECYVGTPPTTPTVVDSASALAALFSADAGPGCTTLPLPTGVDYTADRVVVVGAGGFTAASMTVYEVGSSTVLDVGLNDFGALPERLVYLVVLPVADTTSLTLMTCTTTCSGACPG
jgi:hypothetical protein